MSERLIPNQYSFIKEFNDKYKLKFNDSLFKRDTDTIIEELVKAICSCERDGRFVIKVHSINIIEDYEQIQEMLKEYESIKYKNRKKKQINTYEYIDLKDSDVKLLIVNYYIEAKGNSELFPVYILVPRIVDKFYFKINGRYYSSMYEITYASTYNKTTSATTKSPTIIFNPLPPYIKVVKSKDNIDLANGLKLHCKYYSVTAFSKTVNAILYIISKYGFYGALEFLGLKYIYVYNKEPLDNPNMYIIKAKKYYITVPKHLYNTDTVTQTFIYLLYSHSNSINDYLDIYSNEFWISVLGKQFAIKHKYDKGLSVLESFEGTYDISTRESIKLPYEHKKDMYCIVRWIMREFNILIRRENVDITTKKVRYAEYIASLYIMKLCKSIYRLSDNASKTTVDKIRKAITTKPTQLLESISNCNLIPYKNCCNDLDSFNAINYTYKSVSTGGGSGNVKSRNRAVPEIFKYIHLSQFGRVDVSSSSKSSPGMTGIICPTVELKDGHFVEFEEPVTWEDNYNTTLNEYIVSNNKQELFEKIKDDTIIEEPILDVKSLIKDELLDINESNNKYENNNFLDVDIDDGGVLNFD